MEYTPADLRALLARRNLKQVDIADLMGISYTLLSFYLNGRRPMPEGFAARLVALADDLTPEAVGASR